MCLSFGRAHIHEVLETILCECKVICDVLCLWIGFEVDEKKREKFFWFSVKQNGSYDYKVFTVIVIDFILIKIRSPKNAKS